MNQTENKPLPFTCPDCGRQVEPIRNPVYADRWFQIRDCSECSERRRKQEERAALLRSIDQAEASLGQFFRERGYQPLELQEADFRQVPDKLKHIIQSPRGAFLYGPVGTGKSCALVAAVKSAARAEIERARREMTPPYLLGLPYFVTVISLLSRLQRAIPGPYASGENMTHVLNQHIQYHALILDDLGARRSSEFAEDVLFELVNERYSNMRPTFFTSNYSLQQLADRIEPRTVSRIAGMCAGHIFFLGGPDRRLSRWNGPLGCEE